MGLRGTTGRLARYAVAAGLARMADEMVGVAVVLLVLGRTGSPALAGAAVAGYTLPAVVSGPLLGAWLAGAGKRAPLALAGNELVLAGVSVGLVLTVGHVPGPLVVVLTFFAGLSLPLTSAGFSSLLPAMVGKAALPRANTLDAVTVNGPAIGGPAIAGALSSTLGPGSAVLAIAVIALLAATATCFLVIGPPRTGPRPPLLQVAKAGLTHLARTPPLRAATIASVISYGCVGLLVVDFPARMARLGAGESASGYLWTTLECGTVLSVLLISPRLRDVPPERVVFASVGAYGVLLAVLAFMPNVLTTLVVAAVAGFAEGPNLPSVLTARQRYSPDDLLAQVSTTGVSMKIGAFALGSVVSGTLTGMLGSGGMLLLAAGGQLAAAAVGVTTAGLFRRTPSGDPACSDR